MANAGAVNNRSVTVLKNTTIGSNYVGVAHSYGRKRKGNEDDVGQTIHSYLEKYALTLLSPLKRNRVTVSFVLNNFKH